MRVVKATMLIMSISEQSMPIDTLLVRRQIRYDTQDKVKVKDGRDTEKRERERSGM